MPAQRELDFRDLDLDGCVSIRFPTEPRFNRYRPGGETTKLGGRGGLIISLDGDGYGVRDEQHGITGSPQGECAEGNDFPALSDSTASGLASDLCRTR